MVVRHLVSIEVAMACGRGRSSPKQPRTTCKSRTILFIVVAAVLCDVVFTADSPEKPPTGVADADLSDADVESSLAPSETMQEQNLNAARVIVLSSATAARRRGRVARNRQRLQMQGFCAAALVWLCRPPTDLIAAIQDVQASYLPRTPRTFIERTPEQWRTSTIFPYLYHGSAAVFRQNFRFTRPIFNTLVRLAQIFFLLIGQRRNTSTNSDSEDRKPPVVSSIKVTRR